MNAETAMATIDVSLPDLMKDWVDSQARSGRYSDAGDYVRDLIRRDQERADALSELQRQIDEGFESGVSDRPVEEVFGEVRAKARALLTP